MSERLVDLTRLSWAAVTTSASSSSPIIVIEPRGKFALRADELWAYRELFLFLIWRDIKVRYKQTALGAAWALLQPSDADGYLHVVPGTAPASARKASPIRYSRSRRSCPGRSSPGPLAGAANSVVGNSALVSKIYFPRILIPTAAAASYMIDLVIGFVRAARPDGRLPVTPSARIVLAPVFVLYVVVVAAGLGHLLSALNVRYRDVRYAVPFLVQFWLFASPVAYQPRSSGHSTA